MILGGLAIESLFDKLFAFLSSFLIDYPKIALFLVFFVRFYFKDFKLIEHLKKRT